MHPLIPYFAPPVVNIPLGSLNIPIHGFGVLVAAGFLLGSRIAMTRAQRLGLDPEAINRLVGWLVVGTFVGGHVGNELMYEPEVIWKDPIKLLYMWEGLSSYGGFLACVPLTYWFFKRENLPFWRYADCVAYGLAFGWFLGRMGCFVAHDHPGSVTNFWLGVYGICQPNPDPAIACHDMGLYEALWALGTFGLFYVLDKRPHFVGFYPAMLGMLYAPARFFMDFFRPTETDSKYFGLTPAQYLSIVFFAGCVAVYVRRSRSGEMGAVPGAPTPEAPPT